MGVIGLISFILPVYLHANNPDFFEKYSGTLIYINYGLGIITVIICVMLAKRLKRTRIGWGIFGFFIPFIACFILPFLGEAKPRPAGSISFGGSTYLSDKSCSACGKSVSLSSLAGQHCPHCGAYWGTEREIRR